VLPVFDPKDTAEKFDEENPAIEIPAPVVDEVDNDWVMDEEQTEAIIA
jgi:hypothetical protein